MLLLSLTLSRKRQRVLIAARRIQVILAYRNFRSLPFGNAVLQVQLQNRSVGFDSGQKLPLYSLAVQFDVFHVQMTAVE